MYKGKGGEEEAWVRGGEEESGKGGREGKDGGRETHIAQKQHATVMQFE